MKSNGTPQNPHIPWNSNLYLSVNLLHLVPPRGIPMSPTMGFLLPIKDEIHLQTYRNIIQDSAHHRHLSNLSSGAEITQRVLEWVVAVDSWYSGIQSNVRGQQSSEREACRGLAAPPLFDFNFLSIHADCSDLQLKLPCDMAPII